MTLLQAYARHFNLGYHVSHALVNRFSEKDKQIFASSSGRLQQLKIPCRRRLQKEPAIRAEYIKFFALLTL
jgi:hypothetical protein